MTAISPAPRQVRPKGREPSPWERGLWGRIHRWGAQNPKWYYITPPSVMAVWIFVTCVANLRPALEYTRDNMPWITRLLTTPGFDKAVHFTYYALLSLLTLRGWQREKMPPIGLHGFVWLMCFLFGVFVELHQGLAGYRTFEAMDVLANSMGALAGQGIWQLIMLRWGRRTRLYPGLFRGGAAQTRHSARASGKPPPNDSPFGIGRPPE